MDNIFWPKKTNEPIFQKGTKHQDFGTIVSHLVVEEKRQMLVCQLKEEPFGWIGSGKKIPSVVGKFYDKDGGEWSIPQGNWLFTAHYEFSLPWWPKRWRHTY